MIPQLLSAAAPLLLAALPQVGQIQAMHRDGQTFVSWSEEPGPDVFYRVYQATSQISVEADLDQALLLGQVDDESSSNDRRTLLDGQDHGWVIVPGGSELPQDKGLFVHTSATAQSAWYAVTTVVGGVEDRTILPGANATLSPKTESPAPPQPVLQISIGAGDIWAHFVGPQDTPFQEAMTFDPWGGYNFLVAERSGVTPRGLAVRLHAAGEHFATGWPNPFLVPNDVDILGIDDPMPGSGWTFFFGSHDDFPEPATSASVVRPNTQRRIKWTIDWVQDHLGPAHDPERVYLLGGSLGAIGSVNLASEHPEEFAAVLCRNPSVDMAAPDVRNDALIQSLFGPFELNLPVVGRSFGVFERLRAAFMATLEPDRDWPIIRSIHGRNDETVGWSAVPGFFAAMRAARRPGAHYFDTREHGPTGHWQSLEDRLLFRTWATRRDQPQLRVSDLDLDDDAGDGDPLVGDPIGAIGAYVDVDTSSESGNAAEYTVQLRSDGALDDAPSATGHARLTPRRQTTSRPAPGEPVRFTVTESGTLLEDHLLFADPDGLVETPLTELTTTPRLARFERDVLSDTPSLYVADAVEVGEPLQFVVRGTPGEAWFLAYGTLEVAVPTPFGVLRLLDAALLLSGIIPASGYADVPLSIAANPAFQGQTVLFQALVGTTLTNLGSLTFR